MDEKTYFKSDGRVWLNSAYVGSQSLAQMRLSIVKELTMVIRPSSIIDIGCGDGRFLSELLHINRRLGIDFSESMLNLASSQYPQITFVHVDLENKESDEFFQSLDKMEMITMLGVIHYLDSPVNAVNRVRSCAKPGAFWVISFRNRLFNLNKDSKYHESIKFKNERTALEEESQFWDAQQITEYGLPSFSIHGLSHYKTRVNHSTEGVTDLHWNTNGYTNWRQFTPVEAIHLFKLCGITPTLIVPIGEASLSLSNKSQRLQQVSSFLMMGRS